MSKVTVSFSASVQEGIPSEIRSCKPYVFQHKETGRKCVALKTGMDCFIFFGDDGQYITYTSESKTSIQWVDDNYVVLYGEKATVLLEVD